jgi:hypothetical protein
MGGEVLVAEWGSPENAGMITDAFCDAIVGEEVRRTVAEIARLSPNRVPEFIATLKGLDESLADELFPDCQGTGGRSVQKVEVWGADAWKKSVFGRTVLLFGVVA